MMMPEDDEILKNGTVDFVSISYYSRNCVSVTQKGEITAANGGENIKNSAEKNYKKIQTESPFGE